MSYLTAEHLDRLRGQIECNVYAVLPVRALAGVVASYTGAADVVRTWLRDHGPIVLYGRISAIVFHCDEAVAPCWSVPYSVTADCKIQFDDIELSLCDDPVVRYSTRPVAGADWTSCPHCVTHFTCTQFTSVDGNTMLLSAVYNRTCAEHGRTDNLTVQYSLHHDPKLARLSHVYGLDVAAGRFVNCNPSSDLWTFAERLSMFPSLDGFERSWCDYGPMSREGIIQFNSSSEEPCLCWTETNAAGRMVRKTEGLGVFMTGIFRPILSFIRPRKLGIRVTKDPRWTYTLVNEQTEYLVPVVRRTGRKRSKPVRFSPF
jgi:hypothetical protein